MYPRSFLIEIINSAKSITKRLLSKSEEIEDIKSDVGWTENHTSGSESRLEGIEKILENKENNS
ncbi:hypothetical protein [Clostridium akagii]|uniref:hypothetical protein n=1 Tax=Clostridium akagii TaxID=91623 RepID=UPI00047C7C9E|nr:hypothetical protein [Clostridium akagii]